MDKSRGPRETAKYLCERSPYSTVQMAAVLSDASGRIYAWGVNYPTANGMTVHAEQSAINKANPKRIPGSTIIVAGRRRRSGNWVYSEPCKEKCRPILEALGVRRIEFITKTGEWQVIELRWSRVR